MRELLSNTVPSGDWSELLEYLSDKVIQQKTGTVKNSKDSTNRKTVLVEKENQVSISKGIPVEVESKDKDKDKGKDKDPSLYQLKKQVLNQARCCQFKTKDGKVCGSRWNLQVDHIQPRWAHGKDAQENLRVLCGNHNRYIYRQQANIRAV